MNSYPVRILTLWHPAPYMLDKKHLVVSDYTPVLYEGGEGVYTGMGYLSSIKEDGASILLDHSFTIEEGVPPKENTPVICDKVKEVLSGVIAKLISILKLELRSNGIQNELMYLIDQPDQSNLPDQLKEINKWGIKKLIVDYGANLNEGKYDPSIYFQTEPTISALTEITTKWDQAYSINSVLFSELDELVERVEYNEESKDILEQISQEITQLNFKLGMIAGGIAKKKSEAMIETT